jgi:nitroimidazol reductase NimA-like FMN-containing flavoprotein (pyridoxamine 5'-phosphate oxidase superfamily)
VNFGWRYGDGTLRLYFHSADAGAKLALARADPRAGFAMSASHRLLGGETACGWGMAYESVCGCGELRVLAGAEKLTGLRALMDHYNPGAEHVFSPKTAAATAVLELTVRSFTGKRREN